MILRSYKKKQYKKSILVDPQFMTRQILRWVAGEHGAHFKLCPDGVEGGFHCTFCGECIKDPPLHGAIHIEKLGFLGPEARTLWAALSAGE